MKETIKNLINEIVTKIESEIKSDNELLKAVLEAYNTYQEDERDGADSIFNINDKNDLMPCIEGGLTAQNISDMYAKCHGEQNFTPYFYFGYNYKEPKQIKDKDELVQQMVTHLSLIIPCVIAFPKLYGDLYSRYITYYMMDNDLF